MNRRLGFAHASQDSQRIRPSFVGLGAGAIGFLGRGDQPGASNKARENQSEQQAANCAGLSRAEAGGAPKNKRAGPGSRRDRDGIHFPTVVLAHKVSTLTRFRWTSIFFFS